MDIVIFVPDVVYQSKSDNLRFDQNIVETRGAEFHTKAQNLFVNQILVPASLKQA